MSVSLDRLAVRPESGSDALMDLLALTDVNLSLSCRLFASHDWSLYFAGVPEVRVVALLEGSMFVRAAARTVQLNAGDCYILAPEQPFTISARQGLNTLDGMSVLQRAYPDSAVGPGIRLVVPPDETGPPDMALVSSAIGVPPLATMLPTLSLPALTVLTAGNHRAAEVTSALRLLSDIAEREPADLALLAQISRVLVVQVLRAVLDETTLGPGWWRAREDDAVHRSLLLLHANPAHGWDVEGLAAAVHVSRSAFAKRFVDVLGVPPLTYLTQWRMLMARRLLRSGHSVNGTARKVGYASDSAFSRVYKRTMGVTPVAESAGPT